MADLPLPPKPKRAPKLYKHPRSGYYSSLFYDPTRQPARKWYALQTDQQRRAMKLHQQADDAWFAGTFDPWRAGASVIDVKAGVLSMTEAIEAYAAAQTANGTWRETTAVRRRLDLLRFAGTFAAGISAAHVNEADVRHYVFAAPLRGAPNVVDRTKRQAGTHRTYLALLRPFFGWCVVRGHADHNPCAGIEAPKLARKPVAYLEPEQFEALLSAVRTDYVTKQALGKLHMPAPRQILWLADVFELAVYTGLRRGELVRLRWRDVALVAQAGPTLYVRNTAAGKTKSGNERPIPLVGPAVALLRRLEAERPDENRDAPVLLSPDQRHGPKPIIGGSAASGFKIYAEMAGLPPELSFHALRKTCATWLLNAGVEMAVVQQILGHSSVTTTEAIYATMLDRTVRSRMEGAFGAPSEHVQDDARSQHMANKNPVVVGRDRSPGWADIN